MLNGVAKWVVGGLVVGGLVFGASRAMATPANMTCQNDGVNWFGVCQSEDNCNFLCRQAHSNEPDAHGSCTPVGYCCKCLY